MGPRVYRASQVLPVKTEYLALKEARETQDLMEVQEPVGWRGDQDTKAIRVTGESVGPLATRATGVQRAQLGPEG